jgi:hypothetical protein
VYIDVSFRKKVSSLHEALHTLKGQAVDESKTTKLIVLRNNILNSAIRAMDKKTINLRGKLYIKFSGEIGEDHGGPRREFFR